MCVHLRIECQQEALGVSSSVFLKTLTVELCSDSKFRKRKMLLPQLVLGAIIPAIECAIGIVVNTIIIVVNGMDWVKSRSLTSADIILTSLSVSRFCLLWLFFLDSLFYGLSLAWTNTVAYFNIAIVLWIFLDYTTLWFVAWLCVFLCLKIVHNANRFFIHLKINIPKLVPWLILGSVLFASLTSISFAWLYYNADVHNSSDISSRNSTMEASIINVNFLYLFLTLFILYSPPFSIICISALLLVKSLWFHTINMGRSAEGFRNASLNAHFYAIKIIISSCLIYVCYVISAILGLPGVLPPDSDGYLVLNALVCLLPTVHSITLILGNSKLKGFFAKLFHHVKCTTVKNTS